MIDLDKLENLHQSTTPGPWRVRALGGYKDDPPFPVLSFIEAPRLDPRDPYDIEILAEDVTNYETKDYDLAWIVAAHESFPSLLTAAREAYRAGAVINKAMEQRMIDLERENEDLREQLDAVTQSVRVTVHIPGGNDVSWLTTERGDHIP